MPKSYGSYQALLADPDVHVVHNATPNYMHHPVSMAAIAAGKHIVSDKPLAMTSAQAKELLDAATARGVVHAVTFNYRGNPLVQQARTMIAKGEIGPPRFIHGQYLQDWLLFDTDYSWRLEPDKGGESSAMGDIGSHWCDLAQHVSGLRITHVLADLTTVIPVRKKPSGARLAFQKASAEDAYEPVDIKVEDLCSVLVRFENGAKGTFSVGQVCAGHKNDLWLEVNGGEASLRWHQEQQNELWIGHRAKGNVILQKDPSLMDPDVAGLAKLPGWAPGSVAGCLPQRPARRLRAHRGGTADERAPAAFLVVRGRMARQRRDRRRAGQPSQRQRLDGSRLTLTTRKR